MRQKWDLNGTWQFQLDPQDKGERDDWYLVGLQQSMDITVPHIWQSEGNECVTYNGAAWYTRTFPVTNLNEQKKLIICFGAVDFYARVWLNGQYVGEHEGGFTPFEFEVTNAVKLGANKLTVRVYDPEDNAEIPIGKQGSWYTRVSGIWQDVYLEERSSVFIDSVFIMPNVEKQETVVKVGLKGEKLNDTELFYKLRNHLGNTDVIASGMCTSESQTVEFTVSIEDPVLWGPDNPHLYEIELNIEGVHGKDTVVETFGMRSISYQDGKIYLNGKQLFIRGALDQAFYPDTIYTAPSDEWIQNEILLAKEMGFNLLRKHIKVEIPRYLYWADRMGLLIWEEPPNYVKWSAQGRSRFKNELMNMMKRDYNHPSIIIWSIYNEEWGLEWDLANDKEKQRHVEALYAEVKNFDPTRLVCDNSGWTHVKTDINDYHRYFVAPEQDKAWQKDLDEHITGNPNRNFVNGYESNNEPIIVSEFGVWGLPSKDKLYEYYKGEPWWFENQGDDTHKADFKNPKTADQNFEKYRLDKLFGSFEGLAVSSQKRMVRAVKSIIEEMRKRPAISGYVVTEFTDIEWETNGWLDYLRNPKEGFDSLKDFNGELVVMADNIKHNLWTGEHQEWDIIISNHGSQSINGIVKWEITGTDVSGEIPIQTEGKAAISLPRAIVFSAPHVESSNFYELKLLIIENGQILAKNTEELTISIQQKVDRSIVYPYKMSNEFIGSLRENNFDIKQFFDEAKVVITNHLDSSVQDFARNGGHVIFLAEEGDQLTNKGQFTFRHLPEGESWNRTSSFNFLDTNKFPNIPLRKEMGWEMAELIPNYIVPFSNYDKIGGTTGRIVYMFGNSRLAEAVELVSGYFEGWIGQVGGSFFIQEVGKGNITLTTWQLIDHYGKHPIATQVLNKLIQSPFNE
jgi:hypothetical protein